MNRVDSYACAIDLSLTTKVAGSFDMHTKSFPFAQRIQLAEADSPGDNQLLQRLVRVQTSKLDASSGGW